ncbi:hypothetical protein BDY24DRAFT_415293 [Mrakia frigida]|uniref:DUF1295 domain-containing protein n=1 Tax=Mrakia frigida TaxID=29902 RepID=UPI003FCBF7B7
MSFLTSSANPVLKTLIPVAALTFGLQTGFAIPAIINQSEKYYDLAGSLGFLSSVALSVYLPASRNPAGLLVGLKGLSGRSVLLSTMAALWAGRLGSFLFQRIHNHPEKKDARFDEIKLSPLKFAGAWTGQATWISLAALPVYLVNAIPKSRQPRLGWIDLIGLGIWLGGFGLEVAADRQKSAWRKARNEKKHEEKFISSGVWSWSRHPNYVGEVTLWAGVYVLSIRALLAASSAASSPISLKSVAPLLPRWVVVAALISPVFEYLLLTQASGVPLLEEASEKKYGDDPAWKEYKAKVPVFFAWPGKHI